MAVPKRCRYRGVTFVVIGYAAGASRDRDEFLIENGVTPAEWVRRPRLTFIRPVVKVSAAVDELLEAVAS